MSRRLLSLALLAMIGCGGPIDPGAPAPSSSTPNASGSTSASTAASSSPAPTNATAPSSPKWPDLSPKTVVRKASPSDLRKADEAGCSEGKVDACRRLADRYRGYGNPAGCGVDRGREHPFLKTIPEDTEGDERLYTKTIARACELGDAAACELAKVAFDTYRQSTTSSQRDATRSDPETSVGIYRFRIKSSPEWAKSLVDGRSACLHSHWFGCGMNDMVYYRRDVKVAAEPKLSPERSAAYVEACKVTHDCDDLWMMIDKNRYEPADVDPIRASFADTLGEACLAGECTCGHAVRYLAEADPKALDFAILGCNDGEAEGCYELAKRLEEGRGIEKDEKRALALYHLACPDLWPRESDPGPRMGEYSKRACDRLADLAAGGAYPPKDWDRAMYYAGRACPSSGYQVDHGPCVRLGRFWETNPRSTGRNGEDARDAAYGSQSDPANRKECTRPSVKEACAAFDEGLAQVK